jgi:hypothetical protein
MLIVAADGRELRWKLASAMFGISLVATVLQTGLGACFGWISPVIRWQPWLTWIVAALGRLEDH